MKIEVIEIKDSTIAFVESNETIINTIEDGTDLLGNVYYQNIDKLIIFQNNLHPDFFDLKTGMAGEILQKFSNYKVRLAIVGNFSQIKSQSLQDFIKESNKYRLVNFVKTKEEAFEKLSC